MTSSNSRESLKQELVQILSYQPQSGDSIDDRKRKIGALTQKIQATLREGGGGDEKRDVDKVQGTSQAITRVQTGLLSALQSIQSGKTLSPDETAEKLLNSLF